MQTHLIKNYNASPVELANWFGFISLPWFFKPLYGILSDSCPISCGTSKKYHRRPYISIGLVSTALTWVFLYFNFDHMGVAETMSTVCIQSLFLCIADVAADGLMVTSVKSENKENKGRLQTLVWSMRCIGTILATYSGVYAQKYFGTRVVYLLSGILPLFTAGIIWQFPEKPAKLPDAVINFTTNLQSTFRGIWSTLQRAKYLVAFCFIFSAVPSYSSTLFVFLQEKLKYSMHKLAKLTIVSSFFGLLGTMFFYKLIDKINPKWAIFWGVILQSATRCILLFVVSDPTWSIEHSTALFLLYVENSAMAFLSQLTQMPILILAAHVCTAPFEAACYATVLSVSNFGGATSSFVGAGITRQLKISSTPENWEGLPTLIEICTGSMIIPIIFLFLLPIDFTIPENIAYRKVLPLASEKEDILEQ